MKWIFILDWKKYHAHDPVLPCLLACILLNIEHIDQSENIVVYIDGSFCISELLDCYDLINFVLIVIHSCSHVSGVAQILPSLSSTLVLTGLD